MRLYWFYVHVTSILVEMRHIAIACLSLLHGNKSLKCILYILILAYRVGRILKLAT